MSTNGSERSAKRQRTDDSNGSARTARPLKPGVYVPTMTFFDPQTEDLDLDTLKKHVVRLAKDGITGIAVQGTNGEAVHLSHSERKTTVSAVREALDEAGFVDMPIIVGAGAQSTREAIEYANEAAEAGGDYILVLPPSYFKSAVPQAALMQYFTDIASASPLPMLIYNFPGVVQGIDLSSDDINTLSEHPNIVGCKLTCGNTGKLQRIVTHTDAASHLSPGSGFMAMGGLSDMTLQTMIIGGSGVITGLGNITPKACAAVFNLFAAGNVEEARKLQGVVAKGDWGVVAGGIPGSKSALETFYGYGGVGRRPFPLPSKADNEKYAEMFREVVELEKSL